MKKRHNNPLREGFLATGIILLSAFILKKADLQIRAPHTFECNNQLKEAAFEVLKAKCNSCHRKQNPFMVFSEKNMDRRAPRIYKAVFKDRRMPKGKANKLTPEESATLKNWLTSLVMVKE